MVVQSAASGCRDTYWSLLFEVVFAVCDVVELDVEEFLLADFRPHLALAITAQFSDIVGEIVRDTRWIILVIFR